MVKFDEKTHTYTFNGKVISSVTQIIESWMKVVIFGETYHIHRYTGRWMTEAQMERARSRGSAKHLGAEMILKYGDLNWNFLRADLRHSMEQFMEWKKIHLPDTSKIYLMEEAMVSPRYLYAGKPDLAFWLNNTTIRLVDYKSSDDSMAGPQLAAYEVLLKEHLKKNLRRMAKVERFSLILPDKGKFRFLPKESRKDWGVFKSMLYIQQNL